MMTHAGARADAHPGADDRIGANVDVVIKLGRGVDREEFAGLGAREAGDDLGVGRGALEDVGEQLHHGGGGDLAGAAEEDADAEAARVKGLGYNKLALEQPGQGRVLLRERVLPGLLVLLASPEHSSSGLARRRVACTP